MRNHRFYRHNPFLAWKRYDQPTPIRNASQPVVGVRQEVTAANGASRNSPDILCFIKGPLS